MLYLLCAHLDEFRPFQTFFNFKRDQEFKWPLYRSEEAVALITGAGHEAAMIATAALLGRFSPESGDLLVNIGICAAPRSHPVGSVLLAHKLCRDGRARYPDILLTHPHDETVLRSVDVAAADAMPEAVDMEAFGIYRAAERFLSAHQMLFVKIVSDHFEPDSVTKELARQLVDAAAGPVMELVRRAHAFVKPPSLFDPAERLRLDALATLFSKSQYDALEDACSYYKLRHGAPLPTEIAVPPERPDKRERSRLLERFIARLTV